jgi:hypothetical protein
MLCGYTVTRKGLKLGCRVTNRRGPHTYLFPYRLIGSATEWSVNADGAARNNLVVLPAPVVQGADGRTYPAGAWRLVTGSLSRLAFDFDDSSLSPAAFPYIVDPTTTFSLGRCCTTVDATECESPTRVCSSDASCSAAPYSVCAGSADAWIAQDKPDQNRGTDSVLKVRAVPNKVRRGLVRFDVSSLPAGAAISAATLRLALSGAGSSSRTYSVHRVTASWTEGSGSANSGVTWARRLRSDRWPAGLCAD